MKNCRIRKKKALKTGGSSYLLTEKLLNHPFAHKIFPWGIMNLKIYATCGLDLNQDGWEQITLNFGQVKLNIT
jgi:hypothetical protein